MHFEEVEDEDIPPPPPPRAPEINEASINKRHPQEDSKFLSSSLGACDTQKSRDSGHSWLKSAKKVQRSQSEKGGGPNRKIHPSSNEITDFETCGVNSKKKKEKEEDFNIIMPGQAFLT